MHICGGATEVTQFRSIKECKKLFFSLVKSI